MITRNAHFIKRSVRLMDIVLMLNLGILKVLCQYMVVTTTIMKSVILVAVMMSALTALQSKSTIFKRKTSEVMEKKKRKKTASSEENILNFLQDMHKDMKEGQKAVLNQLKLQHDEKMKTKC